MVIKIGIVLICITVLVGQAIANISFNRVQPKCNPSRIGWSGCLRGQHCTANGTCLSPKAISVITKRGYSSDARCGATSGGILCDPNSNVYFGTCCSQYGWCGSTAEYCGTGCQSGCDQSSQESPVPVADRDPPTIASTPPAAGEPQLGQGRTTTATGPGAAVTGGVTTDGTCGIHSGGTVCGDWPLGRCCSMYGFCGNTTAHCGDGCQSGPCVNGAVVPAPGPRPAAANRNPGLFEVVGQSGVPAMHAGLMENGLVFFLDKIENYTQLRLPDGQYAYSSEYDPVTNLVVPLGVATNPFCSGGCFLSDGRMINVGGNGPLDFIDPTVGNGFNAIRYLKRSATNLGFDGQYWSEPGNKLSSARWYASAQTMGDGTIFVASGSLNGLDPSVNGNNNPTFELLDSQGISNGRSIPMDILVKSQPYYMYPFMHLLRDGSLFVFVSRSAELFNVTGQTTLKTLPELPGDYRTYPNTGASVLLPLSSTNGWDPDVLICGGGAYQDVTSPTDPSCGRIQPLSENPQWEMDSMPEGRVMVEGTLLPDGTVILMNGCSVGAQGFGLGRDPAFEVLIYDPAMPLGQRFTTGASSGIPRLYHSVALLLLDGTIMVAGSNPVEQPKLVPDAQDPYVTEFRVERYTPPYLTGDSVNRRPLNIVLSSRTLIADSSTFTISFTTPADVGVVSVALYHGGFVTHSLHMSQRMAFLDNTGFTLGVAQQTITVTMPPSNDVAPPGPYVVYVLADGVPGYGQFVSVA